MTDPLKPVDEIDDDPDAVPDATGGIEDTPEPAEDLPAAEDN